MEVPNAPVLAALLLTPNEIVTATMPVLPLPIPVSTGGNGDTGVPCMVDSKRLAVDVTSTNGHQYYSAASLPINTLPSSFNT